MTKLTIAGWTAMALLLNPMQALAQAVANAEIHGTITDQTGAVIAGVQIKATQTETRQVRTTVSNNDGSYVLPNLPVGPYSLEATAQAFNHYVQSGIILQVGNNVQINIALQVGAVTQEMRVSANAAMVETQDTSISEVVDQRRIIDLPLNGRQATDLILLSGGAAMPPNAASRVVTTHDYQSAIGISVSGGQINGNNYLLDGGDHNDSHSNVNLPFPFPDALQEFSVQTNGVSARYGLHPGSVINAVTKSGTNQYHGSLFEFVRNGDFNARNFFAPTQDSLRRNQFGGTVGGPIRKDKLFVFSGYQGTRTRTAPPQSIAFVPTQAALGGDFSTIESAGCQSNRKAITLIDPTTGQPFPNNFISPTRFTTPAVNLLKLIPVSSDPCGRYVYSVPNPNNENQYIGRADYLVSAKNTVYGRYFIADYDNPPYFTNSLLTTTRSGLEMRTQSVTLSDQYSISPTIVNAFHATFARLAINRATSPQMPNPVALGVNMFNFAPHFTDLAVTNHFTVGGGSNAPSFFTRNQWQFADDLDIVRGRHHLTFGLEAIAIQMNEVNISVSNGEFTFNGSFTGDGLADLLVGRPSLLTDALPAQIGLREKYWGLYAQDDIQLSRNLNIHVGVRWEPSLPEHDVAGRGQHFSIDAYKAGQESSVYVNAPPGVQYFGDPGIPRAYANSRYLDFAPRLGLAWDPTGSGKASVRGSYGIFFDSPESYSMRDWTVSPPWGNQVGLTAPPSFADPFAGYPGGNPFPGSYPPTKNSVYPTLANWINAPLNLHHPYMQQWDLSVQRQLGSNWLASVSYLGNKATHLRSSIESNPALYTPGATLGNTSQRRVLSTLNQTTGAYFNNITLLDDGINTNYNALRVSAQHRFSQNFTLLSVYTYSHCLQNAESIGNRVTVSGNQYQNPFSRNSDKAVCDFDLRHSFANSFVYESPRFNGRAVNLLLGSWQFSFLISAHSGWPFHATTGVDASLSGVGLDRPNVVGQPYVKDKSTLVWISPSAFVANAPGTFGNEGYNSLLSPGYFDIDTNLTRLFKIHESHRVELRFEFFNALNHTNFLIPVSNIRSATFGLLQSAADPRILQFALKYSF